MTHPGPRGEVVLLRGGAEVRRWPLPLCADLGLVDALAHLQLAARRAGGRIEVRGASPDLAGLLELVGLAGALAVEVGGEPEGGEEVGVQEVVVPDDPVA